MLLQHRRCKVFSISFALGRYLLGSSFSVWQQTFDYFGAILSYLIQYFPIFLMHSYSDTSPGDLAMIISNVSLLSEFELVISYFFRVISF